MKKKNWLVQLYAREKKKDVHISRIATLSVRSQTLEEKERHKVFL
jgi:hypothetical protein